MDMIFTAPAPTRDQLFGPLYKGLLTNRCRSCFSFSAPHKYWGGSVDLYARDDISEFQVVMGAFYTGGSGEVPLGSDLDILGQGLEYPVGSGNFIRVKWGGGNSGGVTNGQLGASDVIRLSTIIPRGSKARLHGQYHANAGMIYVGGINIPFMDEGSGEGFEFSTTALTDKSMTGGYGITSANQGFACPPLGLVGPTRRPSFAIHHDSRGTGLLDHWGDASRQRGPFERAIGPHFAVTSLSQSAETANTLNGSAGALRRAFSNAYASHVIYGPGTNDLGSGATLTRLQAGWALFPGKKLYGCTLDPITTGSWDTLAGQTVGANEAERLAVNAAIRRQPSQLAGVIDTADIVESSWNSGKWDVKFTTDGSQYAAFDGLHHTALLARRIAESGVMAPTLFRRGVIAQI